MSPPGSPRRRVPRPMSSVMAGVIADIAPTDPLARLQSVWPQVVGRRHAPHCTPSHLRKDGAVAIRCDSGALAAELQLMSPQLTDLAHQLADLTVPLRFEGPTGRRRH